jgi:tRNA threonylcarbamoyladenosine biosynthesis protein TsaB
MAETMLKTLNLKFSDIDALAVNVGPGSFTGVRIGVALVKGIAFGRDIPCIPVSTLESLSENLAGLSGIIVPCMDARRGQFYTALFKKGIRLTKDDLLPASEIETMLREHGESVIVCGDGAELFMSLCGYENMILAPEESRYQNALSVALVGARIEEIKHTELLPCYLRASQAERERKEKESENKK